MAHPTEEAHPAERQEVPVADLIGPVREALDAMGESQRRGEAAMQKLLDGIERVVQARTSPEPSAPEPSAPEPSAPEPTTPTVESPAAEPDEPKAPKAESAPASPERAPAPSASGDDSSAHVASALRQQMVELQRHAGQLDRLASTDELGDYLSSRASELGLRQMLLVEKGRNLHAEGSKGFPNLDERSGSLAQVVVPFESDGLFGIAASEEMVYSGPRPMRGMSVDLVLLMGKQAPAWCLVIPLRYRNRWGRFLYVDGSAEQLDALFQMEILARLAVLQLRAARTRPHRPADGLRHLRNLTLKERRQRRENRQVRARPRASEDADSPEDPLSRRDKVDAAEELRRGHEEARFDEDGHLVQPLKPKEILARIGEIPPMPHVAAQLLGKLNDPETTVKSLQEVIATDQALSARLLQIANSSLYGNMREVSVIGEAVMRLGFNSIRSWLLSTVTRAVFVAGGSSSQQHRLWRQSVLCAMGSQLLAERSGRVDPELAFVAGLLQNIGLLLLARNHPEIFLEIHENCAGSQTPYHLGERQALGFDHADLGSLLLQKWGLAVDLVEAVAGHHRLETAGNAREMASVIAMAEEMASRLGEGPTEASERPLADEMAAQVLELDETTLESVHEELAQLALDRSIFEI